MNSKSRIISRALFLSLALAATLSAGQARAADFKLNMEFHIATKRYTFEQLKAWMEQSVKQAEALYNDTPSLVITPTFVDEHNAAIKTKSDAKGAYTSLVFDDGHALTKFMDANFDNQARTKTDGHFTVLVVDDATFTNQDIKGRLCGQSTFPHSVVPFSRKTGILLSACVGYPSSNYLLAHEFGHFVGLKHTFEPYINLNPLSKANCNKPFGTKLKCNSCQGVITTKGDGAPGVCSGASNVMDYCDAQNGVETLNACQLERASRQRSRYQTSDGSTDYQAMAGSRGEGACEKDADCEADEWCTTGVLNTARNICKTKQDHGAACTIDRECASDRCAWGMCADADECRADSDCKSGQFCGDPIVGKRTCKDSKDKVADACKKDADCSAGQWCKAGVDLSKNSCERKLDQGEICGSIGELGVGHRCKSGKCKAGFSVNLTCK